MVLWNLYLSHGKYVQSPLGVAMRLTDAARKRAIRKTNRMLHILSEYNQALIHSKDETALLKSFCRIMTSIGGYRIVRIGLVVSDTDTDFSKAFKATLERDNPETVNYDWDSTDPSHSLAVKSLKTGQVCSAREIQSDPGFKDLYTDAARRGYASILMIPLVIEDTKLGVLGIYSVDSVSFNADEIAYLSEISKNLSFGILSHRTRIARDKAELERKTAQKQFENREKKYRDLVMSANSIILRWSRDGSITFMNEFGQKFFGYTENELLGRHVVGTIVPLEESTGRDLRPLMEQILANPRMFERNINENIRKNGERVWIDWTNKIVLDGKGRIKEIMSIGSDITDRKKAEEQVQQLNSELRQYAENLEKRVEERTEELAIAKDLAESADRLKSAFLATMSHELRTPLNSIIGFTGILLQELAGPLNQEQHKQLEMVQKSSRHLLSLISDVLDISKIEAGQLELSISPFELEQSIRKISGLISPVVEKKRLRLSIEISDDVGQITTDKRRLEQVILNLLNNAVKFTEAGEVRISCFLKNDSYVITVSDTGIGIRSGEIETLFQPFHQIDTGLSRKHEGTGLGLFICKKLMNVMGGEITVESQYGRGTVFTIQTPREIHEVNKQ